MGAGGTGDSVLVVINMANRSYDQYRLGFPLPGIWKVRLNSDWIGYDPDFTNHPSGEVSAKKGGKDGMACNGHIGIGPYGFIILSQDR